MQVSYAKACYYICPYPAPLANRFTFPKHNSERKSCGQADWGSIAGCPYLVPQAEKGFPQ